VVRTPDHPRGVRFIDGIDLPGLHELLRTGAHDSSTAALSAQLGSRPEAVRNALRWMQDQRLI
jgi:hypothetical protein